MHCGLKKRPYSCLACIRYKRFTAQPVHQAKLAITNPTNLYCQFYGIMIVHTYIYIYIYIYIIYSTTYNSVVIISRPSTRVGNFCFFSFLFFYLNACIVCMCVYKLNKLSIKSTLQRYLLIGAHAHLW